MPADLIDAVIAWLENDQAVTTAFGDTWNQTAQAGTAKFFSDVAGQVPVPWCQIVELSETYDYMTRQTGNVIPFTSPGQMAFSIHAETRVEAKQLGFVIAKSLSDPALEWDGNQRLMEFRLLSSRYNPLPASGPGVPVVFNRVFFFEYMYSGSL